MHSLRSRLTLLLLAAAALATAVHAALVIWPLPALLALADEQLGWKLRPLAPFSAAALLWTLLLIALPIAGLAAWATAPLTRLLRALQGAVLSYRDGDFSVSIRAQGQGELGDLLRAHSELGLALRDQRQQLAQRELLLDTVVQHTPLALLLCDAQERVIYANLTARSLLAEGRGLVRSKLADVAAAAPPGLGAALLSRQDQLFSVDQGATQAHFHISQRTLQLQGVPHRLVLLRHMTRELAREEVASWKRVIRVISHELNNSLAPISSFAHSGAELARRGDTERLPQVFARIGERAAHLHTFLDGYARFAKLPQPQPAAVPWPDFLDRLAAQCRYVLVSEQLPMQPGRFDAMQIEQALINLIKNAHESGSAPEHVGLAVELRADGLLWLTVTDRGSGMSAPVLAQALLPFYSTKRSGTGLGLALAREIAEAHGGRIALANREGGGLAVSLCLPQDAAQGSVRDPMHTAGQGEAQVPAP